MRMNSSTQMTVISNMKRFIIIWTVPLLLSSTFFTIGDSSTQCMWDKGAVNCSYRQLHQVPNDLPASAVSLNLSHNLLSNLSDNVFHNLTSLTVLDLSYNYLSSFTLSVFAGLHNLQWLSVTWNNLPLSDETYPFGVFSPFSQSLLYLYLNGNSPPNQSHPLNVSYPDKALSELLNLTELFMDGLKETRFKSGFGYLHSLTNLSLLGSEDGFCDIEILYNDTFKHHPPALEYLNLSYCNIRCIEADAFSPLRTLQILDLSHNEDLGFQRLGLAVYGLQGSALHTLHINHIHFKYALCIFITKEDTVYFKNTSITSIYANYNSLQFFPPGALLNMPDSLEFVSLDGNHLGFGAYLEDLNNLQGLKQVRADGYTHHRKTPAHYRSEENECIHNAVEICRGNFSFCSSVTSSDRECYIFANGTDSRCRKQKTPWNVPDPESGNTTYFVLPPNLTDFRSRQNQIYYRITRIDINSNNVLTRLDLSQNLLTALFGPVTGLNNLQYLDLSDNLANHISQTFFINFTSLQVLRLNRNYLSGVIKNASSDFFSSLAHLETLDLSDNYLSRVPTELLNPLVSLRMLNLSFNELTSFDFNISSNHIRLLDLAYNNIHSIPSHVGTHLDSVAQTASENVTVNLTYNHIICTCENIEFLSWVAYTKVHFPRLQKYFCLMSDGTLQHFVDIFDVITDLQQQCSNFSSILIGAVSCFFCLILSLVSALMYRFRWKLRYWYYASRMSYTRAQSQESRQFDYDAFVSYSSDDEDFVRSQLVHNLEVQENLRLNVHDRDFTPGQPIPYNIVAAVQNSRHTLVVLTRHLLQSDWCQYEMQMATMEAVHTGRDVLVFLLYEDIPSHELPPQVLYNLQSSTFIHFPHDHPELQSNFWMRLTEVLKDL